MKHMLACIGAVSALAACSDVQPPTAPASGPAVAFAANASSGGGSTNTKTPFSSVMGSPCSGETVLLTGTLHLVSHRTTDGGGGTHVKLHANFQNGSAVAIGSGRRYRVVSTNNTMTKTDADGDAAQTEVVNLIIVAEGSALNWVVHINTRQMISASGERTVVVQNVHAECRG